PREAKAAGAVRLFILSTLIGVGACNAPDGPVPTPAQVERDHMFSLAAMAIVHRDWQRSPGGRGHNIGSLLVSKVRTIQTQLQYYFRSQLCSDFLGRNLSKLAISRQD